MCLPRLSITSSLAQWSSLMCVYLSLQSEVKTEVQPTSRMLHACFWKIAQVTLPIIVFDYLQNPRPDRATFFAILVDNKSIPHVGLNSNNMDPFFTPLFLSLPTSTLYKNPGAHVPLSKSSPLHHLFCCHWHPISSCLGYSKSLLTGALLQQPKPQTHCPHPARATRKMQIPSCHSSAQTLSWPLSRRAEVNPYNHLKGFITFIQTLPDPEYPS